PEILHCFQRGDSRVAPVSLSETSSSKETRPTQELAAVSGEGRERTQCRPRTGDFSSRSYDRERGNEGPVEEADSTSLEENTRMTGSGSDNIIVEVVVEVRPSEDIEKVKTALSKVITGPIDRKSTRLNSSHVSISYAVFCL